MIVTVCRASQQREDGAVALLHDVDQELFDRVQWLGGAPRRRPCQLREDLVGTVDDSGDERFTVGKVAVESGHAAA